MAGHELATEDALELSFVRASVYAALLDSVVADMRLYLDERKSATDQANEKVPITDVLAKYGVEAIVDDALTSSPKVDCVWGYLHADGGLERTLRVYYDSNTAYCFAGCGVLTPVRIEAEQTGVMFVQAAKNLLEEFNLKPLHWTERIERLSSPEVVRSSESMSNYATAFVTYVRSLLPAGEEYDPAAVDFVQRALSDLDSTQDREEWLTTWKARTSEISKAG